MSLILSHFLVFAVFWSFSDTGVARPTECHMWQEVSANEMNQEFLNVTCEVNNLCNGFSCTGSLLFENSILRGDESFGFALEFIPCSYPLVLRVRVDSYDMQFMKLLPVHGRNEEAILLVIPDADDKEEPYARLNVAWNAVLKPVKYFVALEMNFTRIFMSGEFPAIPLVPLRNYPIPNCIFAPSASSLATESLLQGEDCKGGSCENPSGQTLPSKVEDTPDYGFILKVSVCVGIFLVCLCVMVGIVLAIRHRHSRKLQKVKVVEDLKCYSDEESLASSPDSSDDTYHLVRA